jgi:hypothetical protein
MKMQWWSPEVKKIVVWQASVPVTLIATTSFWPAHMDLSLSLGLVVGSLLASLVPPRPTIRSLILSLVSAASVGLLGYLYSNFVVGWFNHK